MTVAYLDENGILTKPCTGCGQVYQGEEIAERFYRNKNGVDGLKPACKKCYNGKAQKKRRETIREYMGYSILTPHRQCCACPHEPECSANVMDPGFALPCAPLSSIYVSKIIPIEQQLDR